MDIILALSLLSFFRWHWFQMKFTFKKGIENISRRIYRKKWRSLALFFKQTRHWKGSNQKEIIQIYEKQNTKVPPTKDQTKCPQCKERWLLLARCLTAQGGVRSWKRRKPRRRLLDKDLGASSSTFAVALQFWASVFVIVFVSAVVLQLCALVFVLVRRMGENLDPVYRTTIIPDKSGQHPSFSDQDLQSTTNTVL